MIGHQVPEQIFLSTLMVAANKQRNKQIWIQTNDTKNQKQTYPFFSTLTVALGEVALQPTAISVPAWVFIGVEKKGSNNFCPNIFSPV